MTRRYVSRSRYSTVKLPPPRNSSAMPRIPAAKASRTACSVNGTSAVWQTIPSCSAAAYTQSNASRIISVPPTMSSSRLERKIYSCLERIVYCASITDSSSFFCVFKNIIPTALPLFQYICKKVTEVEKIFYGGVQAAATFFRFGLFVGSIFFIVPFEEKVKEKSPNFLF